MSLLSYLSRLVYSCSQMQSTKGVLIVVFLTCRILFHNLVHSGLIFCFKNWCWLIRAWMTNSNLWLLDGNFSQNLRVLINRQFDSTRLNERRSKIKQQYPAYKSMNYANFISDKIIVVINIFTRRMNARSCEYWKQLSFLWNSSTMLRLSLSTFSHAIFN